MTTLTLEALIDRARRARASDLHLEPQRSPTLRIDGRLVSDGPTLAPQALLDMARGLLSKAAWSAFLERRSADLSTTIQGVRCRINILQSMRGVGLAVRLLCRSEPTLETLNLHPSLARLARERQGLIIVSGPTGSGKSSTVAALIHEITRGEARHVITLEQPVEFLLRGGRSLIRQRDVGKDTPSFRQGLIDAMREDPDVLMVGEMRDPETMRLTIDAAETGHIVLTTVHSATSAEALSRIASAFPAEIRPLVCAQLADCLLAVVCQTLQYRAELDLRVPECEVLIASTPVRSLVRKGEFFKLESALQTGGADGQWTRRRYRQWLDARTSFHKPAATATAPLAPPRAEPLTPLPRAPQPPEPASRPPSDPAEDDVIVIQPPTGTLSDILDELDE